eukprot:1353872-Rhodomonas_salina.3
MTIGSAGPLLAVVPAHDEQRRAPSRQHDRPPGPPLPPNPLLSAPRRTEPHCLGPRALALSL